MNATDVASAKTKLKSEVPKEAFFVCDVLIGNGYMMKGVMQWD
jgi:hypothetical protein